MSSPDAVVLADPAEQPDGMTPEILQRQPARRLTSAHSPQPTIRRRRVTFLVSALVLAGPLAGAAGCATASKATPVTTTFPFDEATLDVRTHGAATDLVAGDRTDVKVTRWFATKLATGVHASWSLTDGTLELRADCSGFANCDSRFKVEVPNGVRVLRNGKPTKLHGVEGGTR
jgi:hypothetical protein